MVTIYFIQNKITQKVYVGQSVNAKNRWYHHKLSLRKESHHCDYLQAAWNKYGEQAFEFLVVQDNLTQEEANDWEQAYIHWFRDLQLAYNPCWRHKGRGEVSEATRKKLSENAKQLGLRPPSRKGYKMTEEELAAHTQRSQNYWADHERVRHYCEDCRAEIASSVAKHCVACSRKQPAFKNMKVSAAALKASADKRRGKPLSEEQKQKQREKLQGKCPQNLQTIQQNRRSKFTLVSPEGEVVVIVGLTRFCVAHKLHATLVRDLVDGRRQEYKGWTRQP